MFEPSASDEWSPIGTWQLGLNYPGYEANGEYGQDKVGAHSDVTNGEFSMDGVLVSALNTTDYFNGYFGLGLATGSFNDVDANPPLRQAVEEFGRIPSYTYGYTAGASYSKPRLSAGDEEIETNALQKINQLHLPWEATTRHVS